MTVQRIERDEGGGRHAEFGEQRLCRRDFVGLLGDIDMGEHERGVDGERAQHLGGGAVVEFVEAAAQCLAVERDAALSGRGMRGLKKGGVAAEGRFHIAWIEALNDVTDRGVCRRAPPFQAEGGIQLVAMHVDERDDTAIRVAACDNGEDGEQQDVRQLVELALGPARIRDIRQYVQQRRKRGHGNLRLGCHPKSQKFSASRIPKTDQSPRSLRTCCKSDSTVTTTER